jgi:hypothetical protein
MKKTGDKRLKMAWTKLTKYLVSSEWIEEEIYDNSVSIS